MMKTLTLSNSKEVSAHSQFAPTRYTLKVDDPLRDLFLHKLVTVRCGDYKIEGRLVAFQPSSRKLHQPCILIIENSHGIHVVRNWSAIAYQKPTC